MPSVPELRPQDVGTPLPINPTVPVDTYTYDYIIVGGSTAGCVLASRLSEDPSVSVLVVEQGPVADTWASRVPLISSNLYRDGTLTATWWSQPMPELDGRTIQVMRGEALGGTSRINALLYTRGPPGDYERWKELGCEGWGYDDLEPYFVKSEDTLSHPASQFRGKKGPWVNRQWKTYPYKVIDKVIPAIESANISWVGDLNNPSIPAAVIGNLDVIEDKCFRCASTYRAFLPGNLAQDRKAWLKICTNTIVMRLNLANEDGAVRARGVHIESLNPRMAEFTYYAKARREIVLSAGALGSPQILMLSGIGPRAHLEEKNVPVVLDLPAVGNHLQDHIGVPLTYQVPMSDSLHQLENNIFSAITAALTYIFTGRGLFSSPFQSITSLLPTRLLDERSGRIVAPDPSVLDASIPANRPDLEFMPLANNSTDADIPGKGIFTLLPTLILPKSQGRVRLAANNPRARADIELWFFTNPADYVPLRKGVRLALRVAAELRNSGYPLQELIVSVVDTALRVHGVRGLRVCDTSVFPEVVATHTMAPAVVVAEKCAELIRLDEKM